MASQAKVRSNSSATVRFSPGPHSLAFLGSYEGVLRAITAVVVLLAIVTMLATTLRPLPTAAPSKVKVGPTTH
jgi:hypothetical protein